MRSIEKRLDREFSKWIRTRDGYRCVLCGSTDRPECGHLLPRFSRATRWDVMNAACLCQLCNAKHEENPRVFENWWVQQHGKQALGELVRRHNKPKHWTLGELEELQESLCTD